MAETGEGPQPLRQDAEDPDEASQRGFFGRIIDALNTSDEDAEQDDSVLGGRAVHEVLPGLDNLRRLRIEDVAVPKAEIVAAPVESDIASLIAVFRESGFSRLPIYEETLDRPKGLLLLKDLALHYGFNGQPQEFDLPALLRPLLFVPPSMPLAVLLQKMQSERTHMALVIDEYGGVDGLVTIEDLVEQVVGEIEDEHDTDEEGYLIEERPGCYVAQARTPLGDFEAQTGFDLTRDIDDEEIDTLGGLVFLLIGRVPARGEVIAHDTGARFEVLDADPRRIKRLRVLLPSYAVDTQA